MVIIKILFASMLSNIIFSKALGISTILIASKNKTNLIRLSFVITFFTTVGSMLTYSADKAILNNRFNPLFWPMIYIFIISIIYISSLILLRVVSEKFFNKLKKYIHISAFNCIVLGALMITSGLNQVNSSTEILFSDYFIMGLNSGLGFLVAAYIFKIAHVKLDSEEVPKSFNGYPILLIYIGIISMALYGISSI